MSHALGGGRLGDPPMVYLLGYVVLVLLVVRVFSNLPLKEKPNATRAHLGRR